MQKNKKPTFIRYLCRNRPGLPETKSVLAGITAWTKKLFLTDRWQCCLLGIIIGILLAYLLNPKTNSACFWTLTGVVLSIVLGGISFYLRNAWANFRKQTSIGKLLGPIFNDGAKCTIFVTEFWRDISKGDLYKYDRTTKVRGTSEVMGAGDSTALSYIYGLLMKAGKSYSDISIIKSYKDLENQWDNNFISVGGLTNNATERLLTTYKDRVPYYFSEGGSGIIKNYGKYKKYMAGDEEHDYGMIMKISGLNHRDSVLFIIAGIQDLGTSGSAYYLFDCANELATRHKEDDFALIIGVKRQIGEKSAFEVNFDQQSSRFVIQGRGNR